jgi:hypothetical protein
MSAVIQAKAAPESGWQVQFKHAGTWYLAGTSCDFYAAWIALNLLHKSDGDQPVERRITKSFD